MEYYSATIKENLSFATWIDPESIVLNKSDGKDKNCMI